MLLICVMVFHSWIMDMYTVSSMITMELLKKGFVNIIII